MTSNPSSEQPLSNTEDAIDLAQQNQVEASFPIVGIAASAGGLEAFIQLLSHLSTDTGMAFVLIQHLSPDHESFLSEILAKVTNLQVHQVQNGMKVEGSGSFKGALRAKRFGRSGFARNVLPNETRSAAPLAKTASEFCRL